LPKKESTVIEKVKFVFYIILGSIAIGSALFGIERHFAKTSEVANTKALSEEGDISLSERLEISIIDDQIFQQEQAVQRIEDFRRFEQRAIEPKLSLIEKETLDKHKKRLEGLKIRKEEKIKHFEDKDH
jgi:hypothetical protein